MERHSARVIVTCVTLLLTTILATELEKSSVDQHLEWSRRVEQAREAEVTGSIAVRDEVHVDVRQRQCLPPSSGTSNEHSASTESKLC
jgi:adenosyl cobinamide kinase/adenosyl cobinamide phosphate guanylyltransferase